ncbi:hypothetical protein ACQPXS_01670 [Streptomyces sp. CA-142005]|uniref:hypothetical protein n=1 Tax=Streptomyces sp. CA-142005 TaxID=3240052 RepID=UPI003D8FED39
MAEITVLFGAKPGGAERFRQNTAKIQDDAFRYEKLVGTVQTSASRSSTTTLRSSARSPMTVTSSVAEGHPRAADPHIVDLLATKIVEADMWYASNPTMTVQDTAKAEKITQAR